jgi:hypothetical protein
MKRPPHEEEKFLWKIASESGVKTMLDDIECGANAILAALDAPNPFVSFTLGRLIDYARVLRNAIAQSDIDRAIIAALALGQLDQAMYMLKTWSVGEVVKQGGVKSASLRPPSRYDEIRRVYKELAPTTYKAVAKRCGVPVRTVKRALTGH